MHDIIRIVLATIVVSWLCGALVFGKQYALKKQRTPAVKPNLPALKPPNKSDTDNEKPGTRMVDAASGDLLLSGYRPETVADNPRSE